MYEPSLLLAKVLQAQSEGPCRFTDKWGILGVYVAPYVDGCERDGHNRTHITRFMRQKSNLESYTASRRLESETVR